MIKTIAGGDIYTAADLLLDGGNASPVSGYGGKGVLNPWHGKSADNQVGDGPGGAPIQSGQGIGASYNYNEDAKSLLPGSSGSSGTFFQGSGAGGGAIRLDADGDLTIANGTLISASGGNGRSNQRADFEGGGGSGGAIHLSGSNIYNNGMLRVTGGNLGAGGGQILFASSGQIKEGGTEIGNGNIIVLNPPEIDVDPIHYLSFRKPKKKSSAPEFLPARKT